MPDRGKQRVGVFDEDGAGMGGARLQQAAVAVHDGGKVGGGVLRQLQHIGFGAEGVIDWVGMGGAADVLPDTRPETDRARKIAQSTAVGARPLAVKMPMAMTSTASQRYQFSK